MGQFLSKDSEIRRHPHMAANNIIKLPDDRISELPDDLRTKILTNLPTKEATRTEVLSRTWKSLWEPRGEVEFEFNSTTEDTERIQNFLNMELTDSSKPPLLKLVLRCNLFKIRYPIEQLLCAAIVQRHVVELEVSVKPDKDKGIFNLPVKVLTCRQLKYLKLSGVSVRIQHTGPVFPHLKILHVDISQKSDTSLQNFYAKLPALQELTLEGCFTVYPIIGDERIFELFSPTLKTVQIKIKTVQTEFEDWDAFELSPIYSFHINAPKLEYLLINDNILSSYKLLDCSGIGKAIVQCGWTYVDSYWNAPWVKKTFDLVRGLKIVHTLTLHDQTTAAAGFILEGMYTRNTALPIFSQLKELTLLVSTRSGCGFVMYLLDKTPALKFLVIEMVKRDDAKKDEGLAWMRPKVTPVCFRERSLDTVQLKWFLGYEEEWPQMIDFFCDIMQFINN